MSARVQLLKCGRWLDARHSIDLSRAQQAKFFKE
jgi:hypothetical protein